jgi:hypothetical protein
MITRNRLNPFDLQVRCKWCRMLPLRAEPGTAVRCLDDGGYGVIMEITEIIGQIAYWVQLMAGPVRVVLATRLDTPPH